MFYNRVKSIALYRFNVKRIFHFLVILLCLFFMTSQATVDAYVINNTHQMNSALKIHSSNDKARRVVIIDSQIPDLSGFLNAIEIDADIWMLNSRYHGIKQITNILSKYNNLSAVYLMSHGSPGKLLIGSEHLSSDNFNQFEHSLANWGNALSETGDLLLYGCNLAANKRGKAFVKNIANATRSDVAASQDLTGPEWLGGNWKLEFQYGIINYLSDFKINVKRYNGTLATLVKTGSSDITNGGSYTSVQTSMVVGTKYTVVITSTVNIDFAVSYYDGSDWVPVHENNNINADTHTFTAVSTFYGLQFYANYGATSITFTIYEGELSSDAPEINLKGNNNDISNNDNSPTLSDNTDFGSVDISSGTANHTYIIENSGTSDLTLSGNPIVEIGGTHSADFSVLTQPTSPISADSSSSFTVQFNPSATGVRSATISITNNDSDEAPYTFSIQGTGVTPELNIVGNSLTINHADTTPSLSDFTQFIPTKVSSDQSTRSYFLENQGTAQLTVTDISISGTHSSNFTVDSTAVGATIAASASVPITVTFDPSDKGVRTATIKITSADADENPYTFTIEGTGYPVPQMDAIDNVSLSKNSTNNRISFGTGHVDSSSLTLTIASSEPGLISTVTKYLDISNTTDIQYIEQSAPGIAVYTITGSLTEDTITMSLTPITDMSGTASLTVTITDNLNQSVSDTFIVSIGGLELYANNNLISAGDNSPSVTDHTDFGNVLIDNAASATKSYSLLNTSNASLTLTSSPDLIEILGDHASDFSVTTRPASNTLAANNDISFTITFDPSALGTRTATISILYTPSDTQAYTFTVQVCLFSIFDSLKITIFSGNLENLT